MEWFVRRQLLFPFVLPQLEMLPNFASGNYVMCTTMNRRSFYTVPVYQRSIQGVGQLICLHKSMAAWYRLCLVTAAYRSSWLPAEPHLKQW